MRSNSLHLALMVGLCVGLPGCVNVQTNAFPIGERRAPKPADATVEVFRDNVPTRPFTPVARLNVHIEKTFLIPSAFAEALPKLEELARHNEADAIVEIEEKKSRLNETFIYNVTATAVVFTD